MDITALRRRTLFGWMVTALTVFPNSATATMRSSLTANDYATKLGDLLFSGHIPAQSTQVVARFAAGVCASVYELRSEDDSGCWTIQRWLCIASEGNPGEFAIQSSADALYESTNWHPTGADLKVLEGGDVEIVQELLRGTSTTRLGRVGTKWEVVASRSTGISAHRFYDHEYDRDRRELIVRTGEPGGSEDELVTERHAVIETFTLADLGRKYFVDSA